MAISFIRADREDAEESFGGYSKSVARVWEDATSLRKRDGHVMAAVARVTR